MSLACIMILGDCLDVMPTLSSAAANMVFADLPYGKQTRCAWDANINLGDFWEAIKAAQARRCITVATSSQPFTTDLIASNRKTFSYSLVWDKGVCSSFFLANRRPLRVHEDVCVFKGASGTYIPQMMARQTPRTLKIADRRVTSLSAPLHQSRPETIGKTYTQKHPTSVLRISSRDKDRGRHPTQKPVALLNWLIRSYSNPGDMVLDPVAGSFTTAAAACLNGRSSACIEKDVTYFEAGVERIRKVVQDSNLDVNIEVRR